MAASSAKYCCQEGDSTTTKQVSTRLVDLNLVVNYNPCSIVLLTIISETNNRFLEIVPLLEADFFLHCRDVMTDVPHTS